MENPNNVVPTPPAGDASTRTANTQFVTSAVGSATATALAPILAGLSVLGNASTISATAAAITGAADQLLAVNHAATTVLFTSISSYIDNAIGSTPGQTLYRNSATWVAIAAPFTTVFTSAQQIITAAASLSLAHSLGTTPTLIQARLVNQTPEAGYTTADEVLINPLFNTAAAGVSRGLAVVPDATNIKVRIGGNANPFELLNFTSGVAFTATNASWKIVFRAWA